MKFPLTFALVLTLSVLITNTFVASSSVAKTLDLPLYSKIYDEKRNPFDDARHAIKLASKTNRNILIEIGGNWCVWCQKMDVFLEENPDIYQALHSKYVLLKINVSDANDNEEFMKSLPPVLGYPHMYVSTGQGKMMLSKDTGEFLDDDGEHSREAWITFIDKWQVSKNNDNLTRISAE